MAEAEKARNASEWPSSNRIGSEHRSFGEFQRVFHINTEVAHRAFDFQLYT
jgi:hypothetical protein